MITYKDAGVDVERGYEAVSLMKEHVKKTMNDSVLGGLGSFGGFYSLGSFAGMQEPVLVSGTDGVGTKLKIAFALNKHDTVGIDCVAMSVNDIICGGARPLFFLDYIATAHVKPDIIAQIVKGIADGCQMASCALIGGETAEMPGFYGEGEYDMAGFAVGIVDKQKAITGADVKEGDLLIGLASAGLHSNGYSLVRKLTEDVDLSSFAPALGCTWGEELLKPTRIYVKTILSLLQEFPLHGIAHITGGGFIENIPRMFPKGLGARIVRGSWEMPTIFDLLKEKSALADEQLYNTWNMGIGMVLCVPKELAPTICKAATTLGDQAFVIGEVIAGEGVVLA